MQTLVSSRQWLSVRCPVSQCNHRRPVAMTAHHQSTDQPTDCQRAFIALQLHCRSLTDTCHLRDSGHCCSIMWLSYTRRTITAIICHNRVVSDIEIGFNWIVYFQTEIYVTDPSSLKKNPKFEQNCASKLLDTARNFTTTNIFIALLVLMDVNNVSSTWQWQ